MAAALLTVWKYEQHNIQLGKKLGEGGFGVVHKGVLGGKNVAVKILKSMGYFSTPLEVDEATKEIQMLVSLRHPNIVGLVGIAGAWTTSKVPWMIFEYMPDGDLSNYVANRAPSEERLLKYCYDICEGMRFLHAKGVCHRDLKTQNVLLDSSGDVAKVSDLGLSTFKKNDPLKPHCVKSFYFGKSCAAQVHYAKECFKDGIFSSASDVWSFGILMCEIYNKGRYPYPGMDYHAIRNHVVAGQTPLSLVRLTVSNETFAVIKSILRVKRDERPSFRTLSKAFDDLRNGKINQGNAAYYGSKPNGQRGNQVFAKQHHPPQVKPNAHPNPLAKQMQQLHIGQQPMMVQHVRKPQIVPQQMQQQHLVKKPAQQCVYQQARRQQQITPQFLRQQHKSVPRQHAPKPPQVAVQRRGHSQPAMKQVFQQPPIAHHNVQAVQAAQALAKQQRLQQQMYFHQAAPKPPQQNIPHFMQPQQAMFQQGCRQQMMGQHMVHHVHHHHVRQPIAQQHVFQQPVVYQQYQPVFPQPVYQQQ